ncbi:hypothetical protein ACFU96_21360 [Streptomyces sp. NPDC057620]|uniref:hypothetical protein n=1 Tax=Streptomyces sp. NPDC057620 TaxID=3346185 RepID=UPI0036771855
MTLTPAQVEQLGDAVGRIAAATARAMHKEFPHLDLERLVETFMRPTAVEATALIYVAAIDKGATPGEAAGKASTALLNAWVDARLAVKAAAGEAPEASEAPEAAHTA